MFGNMLMGAAGASLAGGGGYSVGNSMVLDDGSGQRLEWTPSTTRSSARIGTLSFWIKRGTLGTDQYILHQDWSASGNNALSLYFTTGDTLGFDIENNAGSILIGRRTSMVFRDPHAFYHVHITWDLNQTDSTSCTMYVNGVLVSNFSSETNPGSAQDGDFLNTSKSIAIGMHSALTSFFADGYFSEFYVQDGVTGSPTDAGEFNISGVWRPIELDTATLFPNPTITDNSVNFDGSSDYLSRGADLTGISDGDAATMSFWIKMGSGSSNSTRYQLMGATSGYLEVYRNTSGKIEFDWYNSTPTSILLISSGTSVLNDGAWHHVMFSVDQSATTHHLVIDGVVDTPTVTNNTAGTFDFTRGDISIGSNQAGFFKFNGDLAEFYWTTEYIDLSQASNRLKFLTADGGPASLGSDGSTPTGTAALIYLSGATSTWHTNDGSGGGFTENGALTDGSTIQGVYGRNSFYLPFTDSNALGLDTHASATADQAYTEFQCNFDGSDGATSATDASKNSATITFSGNAQLDTAQQKFGTASLLLDGTGDYVSIPDASYLEIGSKDFTIDCWIRFSTVPTNQETIVSKWTGTGNQRSFNFAFEGSTSNLIIQLSGDGSSTALNKQESWSPSQDTWYHVAVERTGGNVHLYVNGTQLGSGTANSTNIYNGSATFMVGALNAGAAQNFTGHVDEVRFINGYGAYQGSNFTAPTAAYATPPVSNTFTPSGSPTQSSDTPTNVFATLSPLVEDISSVTLSKGNLQVINPSVAAWHTTPGSFLIPSTGKWAVKFTPVSNANIQAGFVADQNFTFGEGVTMSTANDAVWSYAGAGEATKRIAGTSTGTTGLTAITTSDYGELLLDQDAGTCKIYRNGTLLITLTGLATMRYFCATSYGDGRGMLMDFGQNGYSPVDGDYNVLSSSNLYTNAAPAIEDGTAYFQATAYTGNGSSIEVNQSGNSTFQPDFVWIKNRVNAGGYRHELFDAVRGVQKYLQSSATDAEGTDSTTLTSFDSDGYSYGSGIWGNSSGEATIAWQWKGDGTSGASNTNGTITSTVNVNNTAGFSIISYTGTGSAGATVGHGLSSAPKMVGHKSRDDTNNFVIWHEGYGANNLYMSLSSTSGTASDSNTIWNNTAPGASVITLGTSGASNGSGINYIAYAFTDIPGYSAFGSFKGNGVLDGPLIELDFKPAYIMFKNTNATGSWAIFDTTRDSSGNPVDNLLQANLADAEVTDSTDDVDFLANGAKVRSTWVAINGSGNTIIYMAFAENPFAGSSPATAR